MTTLLAAALAVGGQRQCQLAYQRLNSPRGAALTLDIRTTSGRKFQDQRRRAADHLVAAPGGESLAVWSDLEQGVLVGSPGKGFRRYLVTAPPPGPYRDLRGKGRPPRVAWCFDGPSRLAGFFPDSATILSLNLKDGRATRDDFTESLKLVPVFQAGDSGTSGCKIRVSPDGAFAAVSTASRSFADEAESELATATFLIARKKPLARFLCLGSPVGWLDSHRILIWRSMKESGDLALVDPNGGVLAKRRQISLATLCADGAIFVASLPYLGGDSSAKLFALDQQLRGEGGPRRFTLLPGCAWRGLGHDDVAAISFR